MAVNLQNFISCYQTMGSEKANARLVLDSAGNVKTGPADAGLRGRKIVPASGDKSQLVQNNEIRTALLSALKTTFSGTIPPSVRKALCGSSLVGGSDMSTDVDDNVTSGRPLTMRRIRAVIEAASKEDAVQKSMIRENVGKCVDELLAKRGGDSFITDEIRDGFVSKITNFVQGKFEEENPERPDRAACLRDPKRLKEFMDRTFKFADAATTLAALCDLVKAQQENLPGDKNVFENFMRRCLETNSAKSGTEFLYHLCMEKPTALVSRDALRAEIDSRLSNDFKNKEQLVEKAMNEMSALTALFTANDTVALHLKKPVVNEQLKTLAGENVDLNKDKTLNLLLRSQLMKQMRDCRTTALTEADLRQVAAHALRLSRLCNDASIPMIDRSNVAKFFDADDYSQMDQDAFVQMIARDVERAKDWEKAISRAREKVNGLVRDLKDQCLKNLNVDGDGDSLQMPSIGKKMGEWINAQRTDDLSDEKVAERFNGKFGEPIRAISKFVGTVLSGDAKKNLGLEQLNEVLKGTVPLKSGTVMVLKDAVRILEDDEASKYIFKNQNAYPDADKMRDSLDQVGKALSVVVRQNLSGANEDEPAGAEDTYSLVRMALEIYMGKNNVQVPKCLRDDGYRMELKLKMKEQDAEARTLLRAIIGE